MFWLTLRQHMRELRLKYQQPDEAGLILEKVEKGRPKSSTSVEAAKQELSEFP